MLLFSQYFLSLLQVDLAPTLALLFGVPIPKNNVGILMAEVSRSLTGLIFVVKFFWFQSMEKYLKLESKI